MVLVVPGVKRNATVSLLNVLLDRALTQPESVPASRISSSGNEMMLDSAGLLDTIVCIVHKNLTSLYFLYEQGSIQEMKNPVTMTSSWLNKRPSWVFVRGLSSSVAVHQTHLDFILNDQNKCHSYYRLVHAFTCAGMLARHYMNFCSFAGEVKQRNIHSGRRWDHWCILYI